MPSRSKKSSGKARRQEAIVKPSKATKVNERSEAAMLKKGWVDETDIMMALVEENDEADRNR
jgi:hypothetical protein